MTPPPPPGRCLLLHDTKVKLELELIYRETCNSSYMLSMISTANKGLLALEASTPTQIDC